MKKIALIIIFISVLTAGHFKVFNGSTNQADYEKQGPHLYYTWGCNNNAGRQNYNQPSANSSLSLEEIVQGQWTGSFQDFPDDFLHVRFYLSVYKEDTVLKARYQQVMDIFGLSIQYSDEVISFATQGDAIRFSRVQRFPGNIQMNTMYSGVIQEYNTPYIISGILSTENRSMRFSLNKD